MNKSSAIGEKQYSPFTFTACLIPVVSASVGENWLPALVVSLATMLLYACIPSGMEADTKWLRWARIITITLLMANYLRQTSICWPGRGAGYVVPAVLGAVALCAACKGEQVTVRAVNVLRYGVLIVLAAIIYMGIQNIDAKSLKPTGTLPRNEMLLALALPFLTTKRRQMNSVPVAGIIMSAATSGTTVKNLYDYSRTISVHGITEHMESVAAVVITVGYFALLCYLLVTAGENMKQEGRQWKQAAVILIAYMAAIVTIEWNDALMLLMIVGLWVITPGISAIKRKLSKQEKSA